MTLKAYINRLLPLLGLQHWDIRIIIAGEDVNIDEANNVQAEVIRTPDRPTVNIVFYPTFFRRNRTDQRHFIVHELLHLHVHRLFRHVERVQEYLGIAYGLWAEGARADMEELTDALTFVVEPLCPLPDKVLLPRGKQDETRTEA